MCESGGFWGDISGDCGVCPNPPSSLIIEIISGTGFSSDVFTEMAVALLTPNKACITEYDDPAGPEAELQFGKQCSLPLQVGGTLSFELWGKLPTGQNIMFETNQLVLTPSIFALYHYGNKDEYGPIETMTLGTGTVELQYKFASQCLEMNDNSRWVLWPATWVGSIAQGLCEITCSSTIPPTRTCESGAVWGPITGECTPCTSLPPQDVLKVRMLDAFNLNTTLMWNVFLKVVTVFDTCVSSLGDVPSHTWEEDCELQVGLGGSMFVQLWQILPTGPLIHVDTVELLLDASENTLSSYGTELAYGPVQTLSLDTGFVTIDVSFAARCEGFYDAEEKVTWPDAWIGEYTCGTCNLGCVGNPSPYRLCDLGAEFDVVIGGCWCPGDPYHRSQYLPV
eukprot:Lithocolla_globosa_v1_NODE_5_length_12010_cov_23.451945.p4 type:complete len:395 gc:universal NODE_5_length_12010_cov_23.451945:8293-7109(-)